jgi:hypothetical protein
MLPPYPAQAQVPDWLQDPIAELITLLPRLVGAPRNRIIGWMTFSVAIWTVVITVASYYGIGFLTSL